MSSIRHPVLAVVVPAFRARHSIMSVLVAMPEAVNLVYVVDDGCPEGTGQAVRAECSDPRVKVLTHEQNAGVGAAMKTGYLAALADGADIVVKVDADGQMDPAYISNLIAPLLGGTADYAKGNRFFDMDHVRGMPALRLFGNALLSFMTKMSSGYWDIFDPNNGFTAITADALRQLPLKHVSDRYFFESDMLFRLGVARAVVADVPIPARYAGEVSSLRIRRIAGEFAFKHLRNAVKRVGYNYYVRDMSLASVELPLGLGLAIAGTSFGVSKWAESMSTGLPTPAGSVMLAALPVLTGIQLVLAFLGQDIAAVPRRPITRRRFQP